MRHRLVVLCTSLSLGLAGTAAAQTDGTLALGMSVSSKNAVSPNTLGHNDLGLLWRFGHGRDGWGWEYGLGWYSTEVQQPVGPLSTDFGELHIRPVLAGYGYSRRVGRAVVTGRLLGGYSFNSVELQPTFDDAYRRVLGAKSLSADVSNSFVLKPEVVAWFDLSRKVGLTVSAGYAVTRPEVHVTSSLGTDTRHVRADVLIFRVGAVYSVF